MAVDGIPTVLILRMIPQQQQLVPTSASQYRQIFPRGPPQPANYGYPNQPPLPPQNQQQIQLQLQPPPPPPPPSQPQPQQNHYAAQMTPPTASSPVQSLQAATFTTEMNSAIQKIYGVVHQQEQQKMTDLMEQNKKLRAEENQKRNELVQRNRQLSNELDKFKQAQWSAQREYEERKKHAESEVQRLNKTVAQLKAEASDTAVETQTQYMELTFQLNNLKKDCEQLGKDKEELANKETQSSCRLQEIEEKMKEKEMQRLELEDRNQCLSNANTALKESLEVLQKEKSEAIRRAEDLEKQRRRSKSPAELDKLRQQVADLHKSEFLLNAEKNKLENKVKELNAKKSEWKKKFEAEGRAVRILSEDLKDSREELETKERGMKERFQKEMEEQTEELSALQKQLATLQSEKDQLELDNRKIRTKLNLYEELEFERPPKRRKRISALDSVVEKAGSSVSVSDLLCLSNGRMNVGPKSLHRSLTTKMAKAISQLKNLQPRIDTGGSPRFLGKELRVKEFRFSETPTATGGVWSEADKRNLLQGMAVLNPIVDKIETRLAKERTTEEERCLKNGLHLLTQESYAGDVDNSQLPVQRMTSRRVWPPRVSGHTLAQLIVRVREQQSAVARRQEPPSDSARPSEDLDCSEAPKSVSPS